MPLEVQVRNESADETEPGRNGEAPLALRRSTVVATVSVTLDGRIADANGRMCELLGAVSAAELVGKELKGDLLADPAAWRPWQQAMSGGFSSAVTLKLRNLRGGTVVLAGDIDASRTAGSDPSPLVTGVFVDVTNERRLRTALQRSARVEALAALTSGIAHDVNNLFTVLVGNLYLVVEEVRQQPELLKKVRAARDAARRGSELTRRLLSFARGEAEEDVATEPAKVIAGLLPLLGRALGRRVELTTVVEEGAGTVRASAAELESAIVNLAINARDAIDGSGKVAIEVSNQAFSERAARARDVSPGEYVAVSVSDDGRGIAPEALERVFEPFFSTKKDRGGTGLGMSMVRWFTEQAGGAVHLNSRLNEGTRVTMLLPRAPDRLAETISKTMPLSTLPCGTERVLMLITDEALRATMSQMLELLGYSVRSSRTPGEMLEALRSGRIDLLIVDASAPEVSISGLLRRTDELMPTLKTLIAVTAGESFVERPAQMPVLVKPFSLFDFATSVRRALDGAEDA